MNLVRVDTIQFIELDEQDRFLIEHVGMPFRVHTVRIEITSYRDMGQQIRVVASGYQLRKDHSEGQHREQGFAPGFWDDIAPLVSIVHRALNTTLPTWARV